MVHQQMVRNRNSKRTLIVAIKQLCVKLVLLLFRITFEHKIIFVMDGTYDMFSFSFPDLCLLIWTCTW